MTQLSFGVDLITFFHPSFWRLDSEAEIVGYGAAHARPFWDRILETLQSSDIEGIELTFAPLDWRGLISAYGSIAAVKSELDRRGLRIASGFFADVAIEGGLADPEKQADFVARADAYAAFLAEMGASVMVMGLPMRGTWSAEPTPFNDFAQMAMVADFCNRLGAATLRHGVQLALHPEAHSIFSMPRDVDLLMLLTDPIYVGFCPDTAHLLLAGGEPIEIVARHRSRLLTAHWKDATGPAPLLVPIDSQIHVRHRSFFCALGTGRIDWPGWMRLLRDVEFSGWAILEIDAAPDPVAELARSMEFVRRSLLPVQRGKFAEE